MTDLLSTLPNFSTSDYSHLIPSLEKNGITVADLLTLDAIEIVKRCPLPLLDVRRLVKEVTVALQQDLGIGDTASLKTNTVLASYQQDRWSSQIESKFDLKRWEYISTLDETLDDALGGGISTGYVTEVTGESGVGKTQFLLTLLLSAQLPSPQGVSRSTIYISTEAQLSTPRLHQILNSHPAFLGFPPANRPSLANVRAIPVQDLEVQDHILEYQLPTAVRRFNAGLVVLDSVAANYRAEHGSSIPKDLANRAARLAQLGKILRYLARTEDVAVVVANQVSDRFDSAVLPDRSRIATSLDLRPSSPMISSSPAVLHSQRTPDIATDAAMEDVMSLDYQQRFFSGWGDEPTYNGDTLKTPALGLGWTNQISARIVLKLEEASQVIEPSLGGNITKDHEGGNIWRERKRRRFLGLVFAPWAADGRQAVEFEIKAEGIVSVCKGNEENNV